MPVVPGAAHSVDGSTLVLSVTSVRDGREHLVPDEVMTLGNAGKYPALCGHLVWAAVLACPAGPPCPACAAVRHASTSGTIASHRRRTSRSRVWAWLLGWLRDQRSGEPR